ncbi:chondroitin sulfate glucuronyltransferase-like [Branchiostoma lanceolatum]|uniref:chondroitin sulfate glucuronyltransferase-like n=1 Tax=Branchiostoma lanceolatum TaxID=7740 RepID=UPI003452DD7B
MRRQPSMLYLRPFMPLIVGLSLGFTLCLVCLPLLEEGCTSEGSVDQVARLRKPNSVQESSQDVLQNYNDDDFEPRIITNPKPVKSGGKQPFRARYISTELGIREKLVVGVLTSRESLDTVAVALNKTLAHYIHKLLYFTGTRNVKAPGGMYVVTHGDDRPVWEMAQTIRYINDHFHKDYDWTYLVTDNTYVQGDRVTNIFDHISMNRDVYMGKRAAFTDMDGYYCKIGHGVVLSHSVMSALQRHLDGCMETILDLQPDEWLGRCLHDVMGISCVEEFEGIDYNTYEFSSATDPDNEDSQEFQKAHTVHPIVEPTDFYRLHRRFAHIELDLAYSEIENIKAQIKNLSHKTPEGEAGLTWPIGINPPFKPQSRFDVLSWDYFTETHLYTCPDGAPKCELHGIDKMDVDDIIGTSIQRLNDKYKKQGLTFDHVRLLNGYRRFDPTRGMEYELDLLVGETGPDNLRDVVTKRVKLLRPLSQVEIIPMPYVTETTRLYVILPVTVHDREQVAKFLDSYAQVVLDIHENSMLTVVFIYDPLDAQNIQEEDVFGMLKSMITYYERKYPNAKIPWISIKTDVPTQLKIMDIISKKHPVDALFLLVTVTDELTIEFLNRCRMNTIAGWQAFFPIHFAQYSPELVYDTKPYPATVEFGREFGHFDVHAFDEACFYNSDYMTTRTELQKQRKENEDVSETYNLYEMFLKHSNLHVFRAVEPDLRQRYMPRTCNPHLSEDLYHSCLVSQSEGLASKEQLAKLIFEHDNEIKSQSENVVKS